MKNIAKQIMMFQMPKNIKAKKEQNKNQNFKSYTFKKAKWLEITQLLKIIKTIQKLKFVK